MSTPALLGCLKPSVAVMDQMITATPRSPPRKSEKPTFPRLWMGPGPIVEIQRCFPGARGEAGLLTKNQEVSHLSAPRMAFPPSPAALPPDRKSPFDNRRANGILRRSTAQGTRGSGKGKGRSISHQTPVRLPPFGGKKTEGGRGEDG